LQFVLSIISLMIFPVALACGVLFIVKTGVKRVSIYLFSGLLCSGLIYGSAGIIMLSFPEAKGISILLFKAADTILPVASVIIPFLFLQISLSYGRVDEEPGGRGLGVLIKTAGFVTIVSAVLVISGLIHDSVATQSEYGLVLHGFLSRIIVLIMIVLAVFSLLNFETTWRAASGAAKKQLFILIIIDLIILGGFIRILFLGSVTLGFFKYLSPLIIVFLCWLYFLLMRKDAYSSNVVVERQAFYSSVMILFLGFFLLFTGLIGKIIMLLGGKIDVFLSILGAFLVAGIFVMVIMSESIRHRFKDILHSRIYAGRFDYKAEWRALSENFAACDSLECLFSTISSEIERLLNPSCLEIFEAGEISLHNVHSTLNKTAEFSLDDPAAEWLFLNTEPVLQSQIVISGTSSLLEKAGQFEVVVPLVAEKKLVGIIFLGRKKDMSIFNSEDMAMLSALGHQAAVSILHLRSRDRLLENEKLASFHMTASFVVHDLKNSISMLSLMLQNAPVKMSDPEFQKESIKTISQAVDSMQKIIEKLKSPPKKEQLFITDVNPLKIIKKILKKSGIENKQNIELEINFDSSLEVKTDAQVLETVFINLLKNAVEAMPEGGTITVEEFRTNDNRNLSITDTGAGMSKSFIANNLFHPFQTTKAKGLGIGLYQCREMIRETGGDIAVESEPGKGSKFKIIFKR